MPLILLNDWTRRQFALNQVSNQPLHRCSSANNSTEEPIEELSYTLDKKQSTIERLSDATSLSEGQSSTQIVVKW